MLRYLLYVFCLIPFGCNNVEVETNSSDPNEGITIISSNQELVSAFNWAKDKARSFVQTGKTGPVNVSEQSLTGDSLNKDYIPSYWAGYPLRSAFYSRDFCHQAVGAHLLGLENENISMLREFATSANKERKWFPLWAINFDGSAFAVDYFNDNKFVREIPAVFELVEKAFKLYLWTGDKNYYEDEVLWNYCSRAVTDFIQLHDKIMPNGVPEGSGGGIIEGSSTYNEHYDFPLLEAGDGIASQYEAFLAYSALAGLRGEKELADLYAKEAVTLKDYFNKEWGVKNTGIYNRGYNMAGKPVDGWGKENSWFMPMKGITDVNTNRHIQYLDFIEEKLENKEDLPDNIEAISYIPEMYFRHHQNERGFKWMKYIISQLDTEHTLSSLTGRNGDYPEVSFVLLSNVVEGLMGIVPDAGNNTVSTFSHLTTDISDLGISNLKIGRSYVGINHVGNHTSSLYYQDGKDKLQWKVCFPGKYHSLYVNGKKKPCQSGVDNGKAYAYLNIELSPGEKITVTTSK